MACGVGWLIHTIREERKGDKFVFEFMCVCVCVLQLTNETEFSV